MLPSVLLTTLLVGACSAKEIFRYSLEDESANDEVGYHFMSGEPGKDVTGGYGFQDPDGKMFELIYRANELGFQPEADHLPVPVEDTEAVVEAKAKFYQAFDDFKATVKAAAEEYKATLEKKEEDAVLTREKRQVPLPYNLYPMYYQYPVQKIMPTTRYYMPYYLTPTYTRPTFTTFRRFSHNPSGVVPNVADSDVSGFVEE